MEAWLNILAEFMRQSTWFAPVLSLVAGIITSLTPCSLSAVPMVITYMEAASARDRKKAFRLSLTMAAGMALTFAVFGTLASTLGHLMHEAGEWWSFLMGILMILMALQVWGVLHLLPERHTHECGPKTTTRRGYTGAFLTGALGGVFASHCAAPVMVALLAMVAQAERSMAWGILLMILYAAGHSILTVLAGTSYSVLENWMKNPFSAAWGKRLRLAVGAVILLLGLCMIFL